MKKVINLFVIATSIASVGIGTNVLASNQFFSAQSAQEIATKTNTQENLIIAQKNNDNGEFKRKDIFDQLNLNQSQKEQMKNIRDKYQPQIQSLRQQMRVEKKKLTLMMENDTSESQLRNQHKNVLQISQRMRNTHFDAMLEMREVLTTQQRQQLSESMDNRRSRGK